MGEGEVAGNEWLVAGEDIAEEDQRPRDEKTKRPKG
jgi:hypothetical protein